MEWDESKHPRDKDGRFTDGSGVYRQNASYGFLLDKCTSQSSNKFIPLDIEIDEFVPCLKNSKTGEIINTEVGIVPRNELFNYRKDNGWCVNWDELYNVDDVCGIYIDGESEPQGLVALKYERGCTYVSFLCAAPQSNKQLPEGNPPKYTGIGGHLFAVAVDQSLRNNGDGCIFGFAANIKLLQHYVKNMGAKSYKTLVHQYSFIIEGEASIELLKKYKYTRRNDNG